MKTTLDLDEDLIEEVRELTGMRAESALVRARLASDPKKAT